MVHHSTGPRVYTPRLPEPEFRIKIKHKNENFVKKKFFFVVVETTKIWIHRFDGCSQERIPFSTPSIRISLLIKTRLLMLCLSNQLFIHCVHIRCTVCAPRIQ